MERKHPVRHLVKTYRRKNDNKTVVVHSHYRGLGIEIAKHKASPRYLTPKNDVRVMPPNESKQYLRYLGHSLHGDLYIEKHPSVVELKMITVNEDQLDPMIVDRPDFERSVQWHIDELRQGKLFSPLLVHRVPGSDRFIIIDGNARYQAMKRLGLHGPYTVVENSFTDVLSKIGGGIKKATQAGTKFLVRSGKQAAKFGVKLAKATGEATVDIAKKGIKAGVEAAKETAVETLEKVEQVNVKKLIEMALYDPSSTKRNFAKATIKNYYPTVWRVLDFKALDRERTLQKIAESAKAEHKALVKYAP